MVVPEKNAFRSRTYSGCHSAYLTPKLVLLYQHLDRRRGKKGGGNGIGGSSCSSHVTDEKGEGKKGLVARLGGIKSVRVQTNQPNIAFCK